jgi:hypothetical protein
MSFFRKKGPKGTRDNDSLHSFLFEKWKTIHEAFETR